MNYLFDADTTGTELGGSWNIGTVPNGGYVMAASARSLWAATAANAAATSPTNAPFSDSTPENPGHPHPVTVTTHYLRPTQPGAFGHSAELLRAGRSFSTAQGGLSQEGKLRVHTLATYGDPSKPGLTREFGAPPELPLPYDCIGRNEVDGANPLSTISQVIDVRMHPDTGWIKGTSTGIPKVSGWMKFVDERPVDPWALLLFADAFPPTVFEVLPDRAWVPTIELTVHIRAVPVTGWIAASFVTKHVINGRFEEHGELWDESGQLVAESRQLAMILPPA
jgi:acyl-CoA thioesterase